MTLCRVLVLFLAWVQMRAIYTPKDSAKKAGPQRKASYGDTRDPPGAASRDAKQENSLTLKRGTGFDTHARCEPRCGP